jgi:hypothetical protein
MIADFSDDAIYTSMRFRQYIAVATLPDKEVTMAEVVGLYDSDAAITPSPRSPSRSDLRQATSPQGARVAGRNQPPETATRSTEQRPPDAMDGHLRQVTALTEELMKLLARLPQPWNKQFYRHLHTLQDLRSKLHEIS